jgi:hypothetical protein
MKLPHNLITAKIIADSVSPDNKRMTTMEIEYPRFILAELNTHRMLSKNSASSRAIPVKAMHQHIRENTAEPVAWGINQPGMKAKEYLDAEDTMEAVMLWHQARDNALEISEALGEMNLHKQIVNRITEPWMIMKTVISGTEWKNFFWLRAHADAQPEIQVLAHKIRDAYIQSTPVRLQSGEWHLPYVKCERNSSGRLVYLDQASESMSLVDARVVSASCCAQVSYRKNDDSLAKANKVFDQLIKSVPAHASPIEHQATPMQPGLGFGELGVTHQARNMEYWSGNLCGWIQFRKLIPQEAQW